MPKKFTSDHPSWAEIKAVKKPATRTVYLVMDPDSGPRLEELEREAAKKVARNQDTAGLDKEIKALRARVEEATVGFTFRALSRLEFEKLREAHPSDDKTEQFDSETFGPALIAACSVEPVLTDGDAQELWDTWGNAEAIQLFAAAWAVNTEIRGVPFGGPGTGKTTGSGSPSTTAPPEESPTPSS